ncbi:hypothetical protein WSK_2399 [Novosphingobium sp. Rr 2-17]|uniref:glycine zipper 2TM domain-containing protein n=1 Tax=Novosphingobium sp. Rr 2-17 TaxID=555793 RepID=UPI000269A51E|nr:glycine zipper 2TM domain-containing protein [Novosphingobium sp. Rr 2-17]EIZ78856.1 hypothetical protein WSK_2399 [Novosphingobium sp. Rr 2-17]
MNAFFKVTAIAAATASLATAMPAMAQSYGGGWNARDNYDYDRGDRGDRYSREDYRRGYRGEYRAGYGYDQPVYRDTRVWRGDNGRYYCRKQNGTTGLLIGGAAGALLGRGIDGGRDRTVGTLLGAVGGALLGREVDRSSSGQRCR